MLHFQANFLYPYVSTRQAQLAGTLQEIFRAHNYLHERDGQQFWCWVACWKERIMQRFDGVLWVIFLYMYQITITLVRLRALRLEF